MSRRRYRSPLVPILAVLLPILFVAGIFLGGHPQDLPGPIRSVLVGDRQTKVLDQALDLIEHDYYRTVTPGQLVDRGLAGAVASLDDPYSDYLSPGAYHDYNQMHAPEFTGVGIAVTPDRRGLRVARVFSDSPAQRAGIRRGDLVVGVDGHTLAGRPFEAAARSIKGRSGTPVSLTVVRGRRRLVVHARRARIASPLVTSRLVRSRGRELGVVALSRFDSGAHAQVRGAVDTLLRRGAQGIVLDLRGNGGGLLEEGVLVGSIFIPQGTIVSTDGRARPRQTFNATGDAIPTRIPVVVLVDHDTASAAEIVTAALQDHHRAKVVGTHTFGKGVFQEVDQLSNGGAVKITVGEFFTPDGRNLGGGGVREGAGVTPDVRARDDRRTPRVDEALRAAERTLARETGR